MANNLRKFTDNAAYSAATLMKPSVSLIASTNEVKFDQKFVEPYIPLNGYDIAINYDIEDTTNEVLLYQNVYGGYNIGVSEMEVDGVQVTPTDTYRFSTTGSHIVRYKLSVQPWSQNRLTIRKHSFDCSAGVAKYTEATISSNIDGIEKGAFGGHSNNNVIITILGVSQSNYPSISEEVFTDSYNYMIHIPCGTNNGVKYTGSDWYYYFENDKIAAIPGTEHDCD